MRPHHPVLLDEVLDLLSPQPGDRVLDGTIGAGGHARALLERIAPGGELVGLDRDPGALAIAAPYITFGDLKTSPADVDPGGGDGSTDSPRGLHAETAAGQVPVRLYRADFRDVASLAETEDWPPFQAVLLDVGVSSMQLDRSERGFSFQNDGPLDMRMDPEGPVSAAEIVNDWSETRLREAIRDLGEDRRAGRIAAAIVSARRRAPIRTTRRLAEVIADAAPAPRPPPGRRRGPTIHPATRTFQAIRIAVNDELGALEAGLAGAFSLLAPGGRLAVISFHSLEDRIAKRFLRDRSRAGEAELLTRKPREAGPAELASNPRARSAKIRAARRETPAEGDAR